jgi:tripartite-type tricarboxylate transporter receptor subunit TctC
MKPAKFALAIVLGAWFLCSASRAQMHANASTDSLQMIVGFFAGGWHRRGRQDPGAKMSDTIGQSVVLENRTGASGLIAAEAVAKSPLDGYTIMMGSQTTLAVALLSTVGPASIRHVISPASLSPASRPWSWWCILDCGAFGPLT